jgi:transcriptional regulator
MLNGPVMFITGEYPALQPGPPEIKSTDHMLRSIDQLASELNISVENAHCFFIAIAGLLVAKVPPLKMIIEDVFENADDHTIKEHINKLIAMLQEHQGKKQFADWIITEQYETKYHYNRWNSDAGPELF